MRGAQTFPSRKQDRFLYPGSAYRLPVPFGRLALEERDVTYSAAGATLTWQDFNKIHVFDNGATDVDCSLMSISGDDIGKILMCVRLGTGRLKIIAADSDTIANSSAGGTIECDDATARGEHLLLRVVDATQWTIWGFGIWSVR